MLDRLRWLFQALFPRSVRRERAQDASNRRLTREEIEEQDRKEKLLELERLKQEGVAYHN